MIINNNNTSKQSVKTVEVTSTVTDGVTSRVTDGVTLFGSEKEGQTICISSGCKLGHWNGVTLYVTLLVTLPVTNKKKKKKRRNSPCTPERRKKQKNKNNTHKCACM